MKVKAKKGRPPFLKNAKRVTYYLDGPSVKRARKIGQGNISAGIREALKKVKS